MFTAPAGGCFRNELREYCRDYLGLESHFRKESVFSEYVESLVENHIQGSQNNTRQIRALIALEHWHNAFREYIC
jgi:asparagine synthase (glutamine-hydrolysing)